MASLQSILAALLLGVSFVVAAPIIEEKRSISSDLLATFNLMEQYAAAAYCANNNDVAAGGAKLSCPQGNCPLVQAANTDTATEFQNSEITDVTGYVATDSTNGLVIVSFRGSASIQNWIADLDYATVNTDICSGCTAHQGFWNSWSEARTGVLAAVKTTAKANPSYKLVVTGHSLGGAIAALAAAELRNAGYTAALYTFGSPRIANSKLSDYITNQSGGNYRVTHYNDPVPRLPPQSFGFVHISPEYYINKPNNAAVAASDITAYYGNSETNGNQAWLVVDILAHGWYFNSIAACFLGNLFNGKVRRDGLNVMETF